MQRHVAQYQLQLAPPQQSGTTAAVATTDASSYSRQVALALEEPQLRVPAWMLVRQPDCGVAAVAARIARENRYRR